jgi:hypothetical protein
MTNISIAWLKEHGVEGDDTTLADIAQHAEAAVAVRVRAALKEQLTHEQFKWYKLLPAKNANAQLYHEWSKQNYPEYKELVERIVADFRREIAASEFPITYILAQAA